MSNLSSFFSCFKSFSKLDLAVELSLLSNENPLTMFCGSLPSLLPPRCNRPTLLYPADRFHVGLLGSNYTQPDRARCDVLVLFSECPWHSHLVEGMGHSPPDYSIHYRSRLVFTHIQPRRWRVNRVTNSLKIGFVYFASYTYFTSTYFPWMPNVGKCAGEEFAAFSGIAIISSYLVLFISFYFATYKKGGKSTTRKSLRRMSQAPLPDPLHVQAAVAANGQQNGATTTGAKPRGSTTRSRKA